MWRRRERIDKPERKLGHLPEYGYTNDLWWPVELFCDGQALTPARWPNNEYVTITFRTRAALPVVEE